MPWGAAALAGFVGIIAFRFPWFGCDQPPPAPDGVATTRRPSEATTTRVSPGAEPPPAPALTAAVASIRLPDEVVIRALDARQPAFVRCFLRAQRAEGLGRTDVQLHLEVDALGMVTASRNDAPTAQLAKCVDAIAKHLQFGEPGRPVVVDVPLMFR